MALPGQTQRRPYRKHMHPSPLEPSTPGSTEVGSVRQGTGRTHGKVILLGEHAVVHGAPAIAIPAHQLGVDSVAREASGASTLSSELYDSELDAAPARLQPVVTAVRAALEWCGEPGLGVELRIRSDIPVERGLGSSAAVSAATIRAVLGMLGGDTIDPAALHELIQTAERVAHGTPSGIDARMVVSDVPLWYQQGRFERAEVRAPVAFVVADTGTPSGTRDAVAAVHAQRAADQVRVDRIVDLLAGLATGARADLLTGDRVSLGERMSDAHALLRQLDVSSPELDALVRAAGDAGALGAKLTGGGRGGCIIALAADADSADDLAAALLNSGAAAAWTTNLEPPA